MVIIIEQAPVKGSTLGLLHVYLYGGDTVCTTPI